MNSTSEDTAILISAINDRMAEVLKEDMYFSYRKSSLESVLTSFSRLGFFTRYRYRKYLSQRQSEIRKELNLIRDEQNRNRSSMRADLINLIRSLMLTYHKEKYAVSKKQRNTVWENLGEQLEMSHENFIFYSKLTACVV